MEYYSTVIKNEILLFITTWMDLKGIMLSEISLTEKDRKRLIAIDNKLVITRGERDREGDKIK